jgi:hypothetical protein
METWSSRLGVGRKDDEFAAYKIIVAKSKELKTGCYNSKTHNREWGNVA